MRVLSETAEYVKFDDGYGVECLPVEEFKARFHKQLKPAPEPKAEPEPTGESGAEAKSVEEPPKDKAVKQARNK